MAVIKICLIFLFTFVCNDFVQSQDPCCPCPFNEHECKCTPTNDPLIFDSVVCQSLSFPTFTSKNGSKYTIQNSMTINGQVELIPADAISIFTSIGALLLVYGTEGTPPVLQQWDGKAFDFVGIQSFSTSGLTSMFPTPSALTTVAMRGLFSLNVDRGGELSLVGDSFFYFPKLRELTFAHTKFTTISADTFWRIGNKLIRLDFSNTDLQTAPPFKALAIVNLLQYLNLINSQLTTIPPYSFAPLPFLQLLGLSDNNIAQSISMGALDGLPESLQTLYINNVGLTEVPSRIITPTSSFNLYMANNKITTIKKDDFKYGDALKVVVLANNPITSIEMGGFWPLHVASNIDLTNTQLTQIDLSVFPNMYECTITLDSSALLKIMTVSDISKVSWTANILIRQTGLETIDKKINDLLQQKTLVQIDLSNNVHLKCFGLEWLAAFLLQPRIKIDGALCADYGNMLLSEFLKGGFTTPTTPSVATTTSTTTTPTTTSTSTGTATTTTSTSHSTTSASSTSSGTSTTSTSHSSTPLISSTFTSTRTSFLPLTTTLVSTAPITTTPHVITTSTHRATTTRKSSGAITSNRMLVVALVISVVTVGLFYR